MVDIRNYFCGKPRAQRWMIAAVGLCAISQFFLYLNDESVAGLNDTINLQYATSLVIFDPGAIGSGWQLHPQAVVLLPVLAFLFLRDEFVRSRWFIRFGYWIGAVMLFASITPAAPFRGAIGALLGFASLLIAIVAAVMHGRSVRAT